MPDLEARLTDLSAAIDWPPTPDLRVTLPVRRQASGWGRLIAVAAAVVLAVTALLAYTPTRTAIADFLNLHTTVHRVPHLATPTPHPSGAVGQRLGLGTPTTLSEAQTEVGWRIVLPSTLGVPDEVYLLPPPGGPSAGEVTLVYTTRPDIKESAQTGISVLVTEARGTVSEQFFGKTIGPGTTIETVSVNGHKGWWIAGQPHVFAFTDANGNVYFDTLRLATNTLVIDDSGTIVRIEGDMTRDQAFRIAASL